MNDVLSKYIQIAIEIVIFSLLIGIIVLFGGIAREALNHKVESNAIMTELNHYREVYRYIELADNGVEVSGDDIVQFTTEFKRMYDVDIRKSNGTKNLKKTDVTSDDWETAEILDYLGSTLTHKYTITYIENNDTNLIEKFIFTFSS